MFNKRDLKYLARSGSLRFMRESRPGQSNGSLCHYQWRGAPIYFRAGTSDAGLIYNILLKSGRKSEYWTPPDLKPQVILDIGGNIGISSIYFAGCFPQARIYAFEPVKANFELLQRNIAPYPNIRAFPVGLGDQNATVELYGSDDPTNHGGYTVLDRHNDGGRKTTIELRNANDFLREQGITRVDMIKIDTEGSEHRILTSLDPSLLKGVKWIVGELHGERDFELLDFLSKEFDIGVTKPIKKRAYMFTACSKAVVRQISF